MIFNLSFDVKGKARLKEGQSIDDAATKMGLKKVRLYLLSKADDDDPDIYFPKFSCNVDESDTDLSENSTDTEEEMNSQETMQDTDECGRKNE